MARIDRIQSESLQPGTLGENMKIYPEASRFISLLLRYGSASLYRPRRPLHHPGRPNIRRGLVDAASAAAGARTVQGFVASSREGSRRVGRNEVALREPVTRLRIGFEPLKRKVTYVGQENSNRTGAAGGIGTGLVEGFLEKVITQ